MVFKDKVQCLFLFLILLFVLFVSESNTIVTELWSYHWGLSCTYVSWLSHVATNKSFFSSNDYFSHKLQRWQSKISLKKRLLQPGIEPTTSRSWVGYDINWAMWLGLWNFLLFFVNWEMKQKPGCWLVGLLFGCLTGWLVSWLFP